MREKEMRGGGEKEEMERVGLEDSEGEGEENEI